MSVLLVRRKSLALKTASKLEAVGLKPVLLPLFGLKDTNREIIKADYGLVVVTSRSVFEILNLREQNQESFDWLKSIPIACVGDQTSADAKSFGFETVFTAGADVSELGKLVSEQIPISGDILYLSGEKRKPELELNLDRLQLPYTCLELYTIEAFNPGKNLIEQVFNNAFSTEESIVFLYSEEQARHFWALVDQHELKNLVKNVVVICISQNVAIQSEKFVYSKIRVAKQKDEASMIECALELVKQ